MMKHPDPEQPEPAAPEAALAERLRESEKRLREVQRIAGVGSWDWNVATDELWWSDQIYEIFGLDPTRFGVTYDAFLGCVHPDDVAKVQRAVNLSLRTGAGYEIDHRILLSDGAVRFVRERGETIHDEAGNPRRMVGTVQDVTERHLGEQALRASEGRLTAIIGTAPEAVIVTDRGGTIEVFNRGAEAIFGYTAAEVLGQPLDILIPVGLRGTHRAQMAAFKTSSEERRMMDARGEISGMRKDGSVFPAAASVSKIDIDGDMVFIAILRDVSEIKRAEKNMSRALNEAEQANRAKSEFLATMSHELRTPLNAILGFSEILRNAHLGPLGNDKYGEYAGHIFESGEYLLSLVNDLLDFSAIEDGRRALDLAPMCLRRVIQDCLNIVRDKAEGKGITLISNVAPDLGDILGDRRAVQQILLNLLSNSVKFTPEQGTVRVSCQSVGPEVRLAVADTGIGIPSEILPTLTNPFRQFTKNPYRSEKGWGLGLSITKSLVDLHGGSLAIDSEVDRGTTITVSLPYRAAEPCTACGTAPSEAAADRPGAAPGDAPETA